MPTNGTTDTDGSSGDIGEARSGEIAGQISRESPADTGAGESKSSAGAEPRQEVRQSLDGVEAITLDCERLDLVIEGDTNLSGVVRLGGASGEHAPELRVDGANLVLFQRGHHKPNAGAPLVLRVPREGCPSIQAKVQAGRLDLRQVQAAVSLNKGAGGVEVTGGAGALHLNSGSGPVSVADRDGTVAHNGGTGGIEVTRCGGPIHINQGSGGVRLIECQGAVAINAGSGGVTVERPQSQEVNVNAGSGGVHIQGGSLTGLNVNASSGNVECTAQLTLPEPGKTARYSINAGSGQVAIDLPPDVPLRVEAIVKEGDVTSDVPLVEVGLPGQRGSARRYVGVANIPAGSAPDRRIDVRIRAEKGSVHLRLPAAVTPGMLVTPGRAGASGLHGVSGTSGVSGAPGTPLPARSQAGPVEKDRDGTGRNEAVHAVLDSLERREISVDQAEALLSALGS
jgi:hypothetical protein